jgi:hypothetical protein
MNQGFFFAGMREIIYKNLMEYVLTVALFPIMLYPTQFTILSQNISY